MADVVLKPQYSNFVFSPDYKFLTYKYSIYEASISLIYSIDIHQTIDLKFPGDTAAFTPDSKYFYACAEGGMMEGSMAIYQLPTMKSVFSSASSSFNCSYDNSKQQIKFTGYKLTNDGSEEIISQYEFLTRTGTLRKIK
jgi:hypothetical protein